MDSFNPLRAIRFFSTPSAMPALFLALLISIFSLQSQAQTISPQALEYLDGALNAYDSLPPLSMLVETVATYPVTPIPSDIEAQNYVIRQYIDGERLDTAWLSFETKNGNEELTTEKRGLWTGGRYYFRQQYLQPEPSDIQPSVSEKYEKSRRLLHWNAGGGFLMGNYPGGDFTLRQNLDGLEYGVVRSQHEDVNGNECVVLDLKNQNGEFTLWLDPSIEYQIRRAKLTKRDGDLYHGKRISGEDGEDSEGFIHFEIEIDDLRFSEIQGITIPTSGQMTVRARSGDGQLTVMEYRVSRSEIIFDPDFEALGAFVMDGIPDGTHVSHMEMKGFPFIWMDGGLVVDVGEDIIASIDEEISGQLASDFGFDLQQQPVDEQATQNEGAADRPVAPTPPRTSFKSLGMLGAIASGVAALVFLVWRIRSKG